MTQARLHDLDGSARADQSRGVEVAKSCEVSQSGRLDGRSALANIIEKGNCWMGLPRSFVKTRPNPGWVPNVSIWVAIAFAT